MEAERQDRERMRRDLAELLGHGLVDGLLARRLGLGCGSLDTRQESDGGRLRVGVDVEDELQLFAASGALYLGLGRGGELAHILANVAVGTLERYCYFLHTSFNLQN